MPCEDREDLMRFCHEYGIDHTACQSWVDYTWAAIFALGVSIMFNLVGATAAFLTQFCLLPVIGMTGGVFFLLNFTTLVAFICYIIALGSYARAPMNEVFGVIGPSLYNKTLTQQFDIHRNNTESAAWEAFEYGYGYDLVAACAALFALMVIVGCAIMYYWRIQWRRRGLQAGLRACCLGDLTGVGHRHY